MCVGRGGGASSAKHHQGNGPASSLEPVSTGKEHRAVCSGGLVVVVGRGGVRRLAAYYQGGIIGVIVLAQQGAVFGIQSMSDSSFFVNLQVIREGSLSPSHKQN